MKKQTIESLMKEICRADQTPIKVWHLTKVEERILPSGRILSFLYVVNKAGEILHGTYIKELPEARWDPANSFEDLKLQLEFKKRFKIEKGKLIMTQKKEVKNKEALNLIKKVLNSFFGEIEEFSLSKPFKVYKVYTDYISRGGNLKFYFSINIDNRIYRSQLFTENNSPENQINNLSRLDKALLNKFIKVSPTISSEGISITAHTRAKNERNKNGFFRVQNK